MSTSDIIQIFSIIVSFLLGVIAIAISVLTYRRDIRLYEETNRPRIVIYYELINIGTLYGYFVIKNAGKSGAYITKFDYDDFLDLKLEAKYLKNFKIISRQSKEIEGFYLSPGQTFLFPYYDEKTKDNLINFEISYTANHKKIYNEHYQIRQSAYASIPDTQSNKPPEDRIAKILKELLFRNL